MARRGVVGDHRLLLSQVTHAHKIGALQVRGLHRGVEYSWPRAGELNSEERYIICKPMIVPFVFTSILPIHSTVLAA